jgi:hypothetical protein
MPKERVQPSRPDPTRRVAFSIAGRVEHWEPTSRQLTMGGRILEVADSVSFLVGVRAGVPIVASGIEPSAPGARWIVTQLRVA